MARKQDILVGAQDPVISHWKEGKSVCGIGKILKLMSPDFNIVNGFKKTNSVENKQRSGRPKTFNEREERWIVNPKTVRNVLRKHKYHGRVPQRKPYISKANRQARLAFAKMYKLPELANRRGVVFHQDNARPHTSVVTPEPLEAWLESFNASTIQSGPGIKRLPPFLALQNFQNDKKLGIREDCENRLLVFFANKDQDLYERGNMKLPLKLQQIMQQNCT
ncbi:HTH_Tnp_Tc3_2 domain-containing protein [Trichonephila clavipes]|nr:HTH_Tnp_Tc3_2 domain-containing protein [Trichonephila clavipes]